LISKIIQIVLFDIRQDLRHPTPIVAMVIRITYRREEDVGHPYRSIAGHSHGKSSIGIVEVVQG
jgi:hypothetical protein